MIVPFATLFLHPTLSSNVIYVDFNNKVHIIFSNLTTTKNVRRLTCEEFLNIIELEKINLHIPYILSLLNE